MNDELLDKQAASNSRDLELWRAMTRLLNMGQLTFQNTQEGLDYLCQEIVQMTGGEASLVLFQATRNEQASFAPALSIPVAYCGKHYGRLEISATAGYPLSPMLPPDVRLLLGICIGSLLYILENNVYMQSEQLHFDSNARQTLTKREREVLRRMGQGLSDLSIAQSLSIELSTVESHQRKIYPKLGVHNKQDALKAGRRLGLINTNSAVR